MIGRIIFPAVLLLAAWFASQPSASAPASSAPSSPPSASRPSVAATSLRVARSPDGLQFVAQDDVFAPRAACPTITRLPDGTLLALFDHAPSAATPGESLLCVSRSADEGRNWTPAQPIRLAGPDASAMSARHGSFLLLPDATLRMFFVATTRTNAQPGRASIRPGRRRPTPLPVRTSIRMAVTRNGLDYPLDESLCLAVPHGFDPRPMAVRINSTIHLFVCDLREADDPRTPESAAVAHFISRDQRRWAELTPLALPGLHFSGGFAPAGRFIRAYVESHDALVSLTSKDGRNWTREPGLRLPRGSSPAVAPLKDGSFLMLYGSADAPEIKLPLSALAGPAPNDPQQPAAASWPPFSGPAEKDAALAMQPNAAEPDQAIPAQAENPDPLLPPKPDFQHKVDYLSWYRDTLLDQGGDNAYPYYAAFMEEPGDAPGSKPPWPELKNLFTDDAYKAPPGPWNPADHPAWEASNAAAQELFQMFREAATHENFATPVQFGDSLEKAPDGEPLLAGIILPHLGQHRNLAKALLADAWRSENGTVSPDNMMQAWQTTLSGVRQLRQGATLIEQLVANAEQTLVQENARWALQREVFDADHMQQALDLLRTQDPEPVDPTTALRGEYVMAMDLTQYMFTPAAPGESIGVNPKRVDYLQSIGMFNDAATAENLKKMTPQDATRTVDALDAYYRDLAVQMRTGYPTVRAADLNALSENVAKTSAATHALLPAMGRVQQIRTRAEAGRRATQLSYALHIYKAETGRWPASLAELPPQYGDAMRTDPFTGQPFGYRVMPNGPLIYSLSENGRDDNGIHAKKWSDDVKNGASDDYVFWPPQPKQ